MDLSVETVAEMAEEWRPVVGFDGYEVSNLGLVRSWRLGGNNHRSLRKAAMVLAPKTRKGGHLEVGMNRDGRRFWRLDTKPESRRFGDTNGMRIHMDEGLLRGEKNGRAIICEDDVRLIRASSDSARSLAAKYGVSRPLIWAVRARRLWKHVA